MQITLDIPDKYVAETDAESLARKLKLYVALLLYEADQLSIGAARELAEVDIYTFMEACKRHGIPVIRYSAEEVEKELERLRVAER